MTIGSITLDREKPSSRPALGLSWPPALSQPRCPVGLLSVGSSLGPGPDRRSISRSDGEEASWVCRGLQNDAERQRPRGAGRPALGRDPVRMLNRQRRRCVGGRRGRVAEFHPATMHGRYFGVQVKRSKFDPSDVSKMGNIKIGEVPNHEVFHLESDRKALAQHACVVAGARSLRRYATCSTGPCSVA